MRVLMCTEKGLGLSPEEQWQLINACESNGFALDILGFCHATSIFNYPVGHYDYYFLVVDYPRLISAALLFEDISKVTVLYCGFEAESIVASAQTTVNLFSELNIVSAELLNLDTLQSKLTEVYSGEL
ncbi:hypothetical protein [Pseudoalteromonas marina]|uniref:DUF2241 domain-containing protein n=1 Tax=Pseudoalteromonas marina TaxID=267375 RepID=A0ABT9FGH0_9GAMM|nr:hypothetical protein [Pseudoalteromonas marina]MDP2565883.1 hypothetical protein [Pseudoalteromonas marina]